MGAGPNGNDLGVIPVTVTATVSRVEHAHSAVQTERLGGLDGLRGLAMFMVILSHVYLLNIGWTGLQSFFVLSGFLITRILLSDRKNSATFGDYLKRFYIRRTLRVFPLYYFYLILLAITVFVFGGGLASLSTNLPYAFFYVYNFFHLSEAHRHSFEMDHLWSLSVEEQFYLFWPFVVFSLRKKTLTAALLFIVAIGPLLRLATVLIWPPSVGVALTHDMPLAAYLLTTSHVDAFALGALINFVNFRPKSWHLAVFGIAAIFLGMIFHGPGLSPLFPGGPYLSLGWPLKLQFKWQIVLGYSIVNLFWFLVILAILHNDGVKRFFALPLLDYLGKRSYSTYIIHYPALSAMLPVWAACQGWADNRIAGTLVFLLIYLPVTLLLAHLTHRYVETPMLNLKDRFSTAPKPVAHPHAPARPASQAAEENT